MRFFKFKFICDFYFECNALLRASYLLHEYSPLQLTTILPFLFQIDSWPATYNTAQSKYQLMNFIAFQFSIQIKKN